MKNKGRKNKNTYQMKVNNIVVVVVGFMDFDIYMNIITYLSLSLVFFFVVETIMETEWRRRQWWNERKKSHQFSKF